jgi:hypothetical protein
LIVLGQEPHRGEMRNLTDPAGRGPGHLISWWGSLRSTHPTIYIWPTPNSYVRDSSCGAGREALQSCRPSFPFWWGRVARVARASCPCFGKHWRSISAAQPVGRRDGTGGAPPIFFRDNALCRRKGIRRRNRPCWNGQ